MEAFLRDALGQEGASSTEPLISKHFSVAYRVASRTMSLCVLLLLMIGACAGPAAPHSRPKGSLLMPICRC
jgi:hypothetical protein